MSLLQRYRAMPEKVRMLSTAIIAALIGLLTYEVIYYFVRAEPRATISWVSAFLIGVARQHGLHRVLTFSERESPDWRSLRRAYLMYSSSMLFGAGPDWVLVERVHVHHRLAWFICLLSTASISLLFLKRFVFVEPAKSGEPETPVTGT